MRLIKFLIICLIPVFVMAQTPIFFGDGGIFGKVTGKTRLPIVIIDTVAITAGYGILKLNRRIKTQIKNVIPTSKRTLYATITPILGDTTKKIEKRLVQAERELEADILKIAHHGSKTSTARELLEVVRPEIAIISVSKDNRYGHPSAETLASLTEYGINIRRTDQEGTIFFYLK